MNEHKGTIAAEEQFWKKVPRVRPAPVSDEEISAKYDAKAERIITETNREKLQNFAESLRRPNYMDPRPFYQRRQRWSPERQSQLIESFLINIPIPPLFVYENRPNVYEVMDGQQRISAIKAFYSNELVLAGLERWSELNGRTYSKLPDRIRSGIDRRSISWVTVLSESSESEDEAFAIKQLVFERLNTGGVRLSHQEIRNALYAGPFNDLLISLSKSPEHRLAWGLPEYSSAEETRVPDPLTDSNFYLMMEDVEVILRFFALRHAKHYTKGMRGFLDLYMQKARALGQPDLVALRGIYERSIKLALNIFGRFIFRSFSVNDQFNGVWGARPQKAIADAVLVALSEVLDHGATLERNREAILAQYQQQFAHDTDSVLTGRGNTKDDVLERINQMKQLFAENLKE